MKKLLIIILTLFSVQAFAQYPATQTIGSDSTVVKSKGALQGRIINWAYPDTTTANRERISHYPGSQIFVNNLIYIRDSTATKWLVSEKGTSNISILNDSTLIISNLSGSDTFHTTVLISNWTVLSDTTIQVCGTGGCDTVYTSPTVFAKPYVDSVIIHNGVSLDTLYYYVNGNAIVGGYIGSQFYNKTQIDSIFTVTLQNYYTQTQVDSINTVNGVTNESNHIISGGIVTYSGSGLTYFVSSCTYLIGGVVYTSPDTTITLTAADATNPRIDLFAVDTLGHAIKITGVAASTPLTPQVDPASQLALTTGITLEANATTPTGTTSTLIYDENVEWTTGGTATVNYNNTTSPYHGTKDAFISAYAKNSTLTFSGTTQTVNGQTLRFFVDLLNSNYSFQLQFYNGTTAVSNPLALNGFGFSPTLYNSYQNVSIPLSAFTWSGTSFDKLVITMTGKGNQTAGTYYLDYISLEGGTPVIPPSTDYSNKVDSVKNRNDSIFYVIKGIYYYSGFNAYQRSQTDSITAQLRSEIVSAAGGGVISFNGRNGTVTSDSTDYNSFFYTKHITDSLLASKISAANLSLGTVTSTSQAINNSAGTGVVLPSASISTAGLMTAGDKVLVNTISGKVNYTDTAAMLNPYLRKADAFTKSQADALYKPITYVPTWNEITGKPTIPAAQIQSDYTQTDTTKLDYIKHKPTIPTNNNQLTNGMGYITSIDTANTLHTYDSTLYTTIYKNSLKLNIADTSSMLAHYLNSVGYGLSKTGQVVSVDTSVIHSSAYNNATYQGKITLTTTGTSGAATLSGNTLNIPQYSGGSGGTTTNAVTFNNSGTGDASGTTFNGSVARTISSNTIGAVSKADSTTAYVTPTQLAAINNHINLYKPLYGVASDTSIHVYTETDTTLNDNSDTTLPTTKAVKAYVDNHAGGGGSGSVTSISQGYGIINSPNPIVSTGTVTVDSSALSGYYVRRKDSTVSFVTPYQSALKLDKNDSTLANRITANTTNIASNTTAIAGKQNTLTLTTTGTSGAATLSGSTLNIPQYTGGGSSSSTVTEQKNYYHGEFFWNHGLSTSTGAFTSDVTKDITDYLPIEGSTSVTISTTDSTDITIYGWTYDSSLTAISEIRSNSLIGTKLKTYAFTTPSNARYLAVYTKAASDSFSRRLRIHSTNPITYTTPITPEQYNGTSQQKIQQGLNFQRWVNSPLVLTGTYYLDSSLIINSGNTVILNGGKLIRKFSNHDNIFRNEAVAQPSVHIFDRGNRNIKIIGIGNAIIQGSTSSWGSSYPDSVNGQYWRANAILMANVEYYEITGTTFKGLNASAIIPEQARYGFIDNLTFDDGIEHLNQGGIILGRGSYNTTISNIRGWTADDMVAIQNIPGYMGDSLYVLGVAKNYLPYSYSKNLDVFGINVHNIDRQATNPMGSYPRFGGAIRVLAADSGYIHNISIDQVSGFQDILIQDGGYGTKTVNNVSEMSVSNTGKASIIISAPIKNSSFINVAPYDTTNYYPNASLPDGSLNIYKKFYNQVGYFVGTVSGGAESKIISSDSTNAIPANQVINKNSSGQGVSSIRYVNNLGNYLEAGITSSNYTPSGLFRSNQMFVGGQNQDLLLRGYNILFGSVLDTLAWLSRAGTFTVPVSVNTQNMSIGKNTGVWSTSKFMLGNDINGETSLSVSNATSGTSALSGIRIFGNGGRNLLMAQISPGTTGTFGEFAGGTVFDIAGSQNLSFSLPTSNNVYWYMGARAAANRKMGFYNNGHLVVNPSGTTTDDGINTLQINGGIKGQSLTTAYSAQAASYTATISDHTIEVTATGQTITLPTAVGIVGREYVIKLTAAGSASVATTSSQTIDGSTTYSLSAQYKYVTVISNGANWIIIGNN